MSIRATDQIIHKAAWLYYTHGLRQDEVARHGGEVDAARQVARPSVDDLGDIDALHKAPHVDDARWVGARPLVAQKARRLVADLALRHGVAD